MVTYHFFQISFISTPSFRDEGSSPTCLWGRAPSRSVEVRQKGKWSIEVEIWKTIRTYYKTNPMEPSLRRPFEGGKSKAMFSTVSYPSYNVSF